MGAVWGDRTLALPANRWRNALTGEKRQFAADAPLREILEHLPIAPYYWPIEDPEMMSVELFEPRVRTR